MHRVALIVAAGVLCVSCADQSGDADPSQTDTGVPTVASPSVVSRPELFRPAGSIPASPAPTRIATTTTAPASTRVTTSTSTTTTSAVARTTTTSTATATTTPVSSPATTPTATATSDTTATPTATPTPSPAGGPGANPCPPTGQRVWEVRPASDIPAPPVPDGWSSETVGTSVAGREITALHRPVADPSRTVVVIGGIHGNEPVSPPSVRAMVDVSLPDDMEVWLVPTLNPDGSAAGTRCNANGVDLNRNFSWAWRADNGGPGAFSEPEPRAAIDLIRRVDADLVVWVHQPLGYVSSIGDTPDSYERAWADASGVPVRPDVAQQGGGESWTAFEAGIPSMLVEVDTYDARPAMVAAHVAGFAALVDVVQPR